MNHIIYLDVSRLLQAGFRTTPSGIERLELAYACEFSGRGQAVFVASFWGGLHILPYRGTLAYIVALQTVWSGAVRRTLFKPRLYMIGIFFLLLGLALLALCRWQPRPRKAPAVYCNLSHELILAPAAIARFKARTGAKILCFLHDLIPITNPEYTRPGQAKIHRRRVATAAGWADGLLVNSTATKISLLAHLAGSPAKPPVHVVPLGVAHGIWQRAAPAPETPYFLCLATIEPRKNHLLLLHLWQTLHLYTPTMPRLIIVGRRGWENEMVLDMLERCEALAGHVEERADVSDADLVGLMRGATALLLPSFAEGYGLPAAEALTAGTPVICSDLPALREVCGDIPDYLDPLDGLGWRRAILDYMAAESPRRAAQCQRLAAWSPPQWERHFAIIDGIMAGLLGAA